MRAQEFPAVGSVWVDPTGIGTWTVLLVVPEATRSILLQHSVRPSDCNSRASFETEEFWDCFVKIGECGCGLTDRGR